MENKQVYDCDYFKDGNYLGDFLKSLKVYYPNIEYNVRIMNKSNGEVDSVVFRNAGATFGPCIPVSELCELIQEYGVTLVCHWIGNSSQGNCPDLSEILSRDYILENVSVRVLNAELNGHYKGFVHREWLNFLLVLEVKVTFPDKGSFVLSKPLAEKLGLSEDELFEAAIRDVVKDIVVLDMEDAIRRAAGEDELDEEMLQIAAMSRGMMFVVTNHSQYYGAAAILHLDKVAEEIGPPEFYVLPSSVHDIIVCPKNTGIPPEVLREMVCDVNAGPLIRDDEFLSNEIYFYDGSMLSIVE